MFPETTQKIGRIAGLALAPVTATVSGMRRAHMFHPSGVVLRAEVTACARAWPWTETAERLVGNAIVRLSSALYKKRERRDVLGCAIRFTHDLRDPLRLDSTDQDLLLATIRRPWTLPFASFTTEHRDFLSNDYWGVAPFKTPEAGIIEWRLHPVAPSDNGTSRAERLALAIARREAILTLEARPYRRVVDIFGPHEWQPVVRIELRSEIALNQDQLRFDPFNVGRGIEPVGFVHGIRKAAYRASQWARPH